MECSTCGRPVPEDEPTCSACATQQLTASKPEVTPSSPSGAAARRFPPGRVLAGRYRIVHLLGRGGMGEVYRADDLTLGVAVALKFLPESIEPRQGRLEQLYDEVRLARQVTHANVCRVFDVGETDGHPFLSMEYIEGEDLATLLKRIGRFPTEKARQISQELASGLAAIHDQGMLHRDFKPANVMIDREGHARISDFGLARLSERLTGREVYAGTPAYMAPEQREGREVSVRSDLYALGLVLYELFTGERRSRDGAAPQRIEGLESVAAGVILRCLDPDPAQRPASASEVVAAFHHRAPRWRPAVGAGVPKRPHWQLEERLGSGGFGDVWLARHGKTRERRVFKFCWEEAKLPALEREITLFRLLKEALGERDDMTRILDWSFEEPPWHIESEYTAGGNLVEWAARRGGLDQVPLAVRLEIVAQVATALAAAHSVGVLHKDVKPANVLVCRDEGDPGGGDDPGGGVRVRVTDFGIGTVLEAERLEHYNITQLGLDDPTSSGSSGAGTRLYMAPEVLEGKPATLQADIYALGVLLYQMVAGDFARALAPGWERDVDDPLLTRDIAEAIDRTPERRPDGAHLAQRLRSLEERRAERDAQARLAEEAELARSTFERVRRRRKWAAAFLAVLLMTAVVLRLAFDRAERTARQALESQALTSLLGIARVTAAAVDYNLAGVVRRLEREAAHDGLRSLFAFSGGDLDGALQAWTDELHRKYEDRHFFSWVVADGAGVLRARSPFDPTVVGGRYAYREWWSGQPESERLATDLAATAQRAGEGGPRNETGLTLAFTSTARGHPLLLSVAAPIRSPGAGPDPGSEILGVLMATLHLDTFNEWLAVPEGLATVQGCPELFVLLVHRGQLLRHPCPGSDADRPPIDRARFFDRQVVQELLTSGTSRAFDDPLRPGSGDLAVAVSLEGNPDWDLIVVRDRSSALGPLTRLTTRLRWLGQMALGVGGVVLTALAALLFQLGRRR